MSTALKLTRTPFVAGDTRVHSEAGKSRRSGQAVHLLRRSLTVVTTTLFALALGAFLTMAIGPRVMGYQTLTMLTGSMAPLINPGDVVLTMPVPTGEIKTGDIITYHIPVEDQRVETHRVTEVINNPDGSIVVRTKGDANNGVDPWLATIGGATVDRHVATIPHVGTVIRAIREPIVLNTLMYGAPAVLVAGTLASIWSRKPEAVQPNEATLAQGANG